MTTKLPEVGKRYKYKTSEKEGFLSGIYKSEGIFEFDTGSILRFVPEMFWNIFEELPYQPTEEKPTATSETVNLKKEGEVQVSEVDKALEELKYHLQIEVYHDKGAALDEIKEAAQNLVKALESERSDCDIEEMELEEIDMPTALPIINNYLKNHFFEKGERLPKYVDDALETINDTCWTIWNKRRPDSKTNMKEGSDDWVKPIQNSYVTEESFKTYEPRSDFEKKEEVKSIWKPMSELLYNSALSPEQIHIFEVLTDYINNIEERLTKLEGK